MQAAPIYVRKLFLSLFLQRVAELSGRVKTTGESPDGLLQVYAAMRSQKCLAALAHKIGIRSPPCILLTAFGPKALCLLEHWLFNGFNCCRT